MILRLGAAVLLAALTPLTAVSAPSPASAGVDITPPTVGICHALTLAEAYEKSDPDPAVDCGDSHSSLTIAVVQLGEQPDWQDIDTLHEIQSRECAPARIEVLGGNTNAVRRSAYSTVWFMPTRAQRDAGATWLRCDLVLGGGDRFLRISQDVVLPSLPLPGVAKCRLGRRDGYVLTACSRPHQYRATHSVKYPHASYPGSRVAQQFALRKCRARVSTPDFYYEWVGDRFSWGLGFRHVVCLKKTSR